VAALALGSLAFVWPLLLPAVGTNSVAAIQTAFIIATPLALGFALKEFSESRIDVRQLAILAVLIAVNSVIRLVGAGVSGVETVFFLIIVAASVFGSGFGFLLGAGSLLASAMLGAGIGPWLPFQMLAAGFVGLIAGVIPRPANGMLRRVVLALASIPLSFLYGGLMTMWTWPFLAGEGSQLSFEAGVSIGENLNRFITYELVTGGLLWDAGRAITTAVLVFVTSPTMVAALKRAAARAEIDAY